jgi:hypothetical protein
LPPKFFYDGYPLFLGYDDIINCNRSALTKQLQTYLRLTGLKLGCLLNFGKVGLKSVLSRFVNGLEYLSRSRAIEEEFRMKIPNDHCAFAPPFGDDQGLSFVERLREKPSMDTMRSA